MRSLQAKAVILLLKLMRRHRIYASVPGLMAGIAKTRASGPALPSRRMFKTMSISVETIGDRDVYTLAPKGLSLSGKHVFYLHGGAYVRPITPQHWQFLQYLVQSTRCTVTVPLYPLAPECNGMAAVDYVERVFLEVSRKFGLAETTLMGDSAGGGLAVALALKLRDKDLALPAQLVLITPWVDVAISNPQAAATEALDPMLAIAGAQEAGRLYAGSLPVSDPCVSPVHADLSGLPSMTIFVATHDVLHHDALSFARKAEDLGCQVDVRVGEGMLHVWPLLPFPEAKVARAEVAEIIRGCARGQGRTIEADMYGPLQKR